MTDRIDTLVHDAVARVPDAPGDLAGVRSRARQRTRNRLVATAAASILGLAALSAAVLGALRGPAAPVIGDGAAPGDGLLVVDPSCSFDDCPDQGQVLDAVRAVEGVRSVDVLEPAEYLERPEHIEQAREHGRFRMVVRPAPRTDERTLAWTLMELDDLVGVVRRGPPSGLPPHGAERFDRDAVVGPVEALTTLDDRAVTAWRIRDGGACIAIAEHAACTLDILYLHGDVRPVGYARLDEGQVCTFGTVSPGITAVRVDHRDGTVAAARILSPAAVLGDVFVACARTTSFPIALHHEEADGGSGSLGSSDPIADLAVRSGALTPAEVHDLLVATLPESRLEDAATTEGGSAYELVLRGSLLAERPPAGIDAVTVVGTGPGEGEAPVSLHLDVDPSGYGPVCVTLSPWYADTGELNGIDRRMLPGRCGDVLPDAVLDQLDDRP